MRGLFRVAVHELCRLRQLQRLLQCLVGIRGFALAEENIVLHGAGEEHGLLRHVAEPVVQGVKGIIPHVDAVDQDGALRRVIEPRDEAGECRLAAAGRADDGERLAALDAEADVLELVGGCMGIAEGDVAEFDRAGLAPFGLRAFDDVGLRVQHLVDALRRDLRLRQQHEDHLEHHERHDHVRRIRAEHEHIREHRQPPGHIRPRDRLDQRRADPVDGERETVHAEAHRGLQQSEKTLVFQLQVHHIAARAVEFLVLIVLCAEGVYDVDAGQILPGDAVDLVRLLLYPAEPGQAARHDEQHQRDQRHDEARCHGRERPALAEDLDHGPHGHDRGLHEHLQAHRDDHLDLGDVVGRARDEAGDGDGLHLLAARVHHVVEQVTAHGKAEARSRPRGQIPAADGEHGAAQRAQQHFSADGQDIARVAAGRFDELGELGHIVRQPQVKIDLPDDQDRAEQRHQRFASAHTFE